MKLLLTFGPVSLHRCVAFWHHLGGEGRRGAGACACHEGVCWVALAEVYCIMLLFVAAWTLSLPSERHR
jgi:hypothetical protein